MSQTGSKPKRRPRFLIQVAVALGVVGIVPLALAVGQLIGINSEALFDQLLRTHTVAARTAADGVGSFLSSRKTLATLLAQDPRIARDPTSVESQELLRNALIELSDLGVGGIVLNGPGGEVLMRLRTRERAALVDGLARSAAPGAVGLQTADGALWASVPTELAGGAGSLLIVTAATAIERALQPLPVDVSRAALSGNLSGAGRFRQESGREIVAAWSSTNAGRWIVVSVQPGEIAEAAARRMIRRAYLAVGTSLLLVAGLLLLARSITKPLQELTKYSGELAHHDFATGEPFAFSGDLDGIARRTDEVGKLAGGFEGMASDLYRSIENLKATTSAKERMESELSVGREIQMSMLPLEFPAFPDREEFTIHASLEPAREVGGDLYDFFFIDDRHLCISVGDVSGKGVPAALFMAMTKTLVKAQAAREHSPGRILARVNDELSENNEACMFVTLVLVILDVETGRLRYSSAGHNPPLLRRRGASSVELLDGRHGMAIGAATGIDYQEDSLQIAGGDTLFLYTDGLTEAMNHDREQFTEKRLVEWYSGARFDHPKDLVEQAVDQVVGFENGAERADDLTLLALTMSSVRGDRPV
jgi:serine phosphatase RsbU (regulator of sigma subunit)